MKSKSSPSQPGGRFATAGKIRTVIVSLDEDIHLEKRQKSKGWDLFLCHASEDKEDLALPLAQRLRHEGIKVWFDKFEINVRDGITQSIERGLADSDAGVLSYRLIFLRKNGPTMNYLH